MTAEERMEKAMAGVPAARTFDEVLKPMYSAAPPPWARELSSARENLEAHGRRIDVPDHDDNTGMPCRGAGRSLVYDLIHHDCCATCNDMGEAATR